MELGTELDCDGWKFKLTAFTMNDMPAEEIVSMPGYTANPNHLYASVTIEVSQKGEVKDASSGHRLINNLTVEGTDSHILPLNQWDHAQDSGKLYFDLSSGGGDGWSPGSGTLVAEIGTPARRYDIAHLVLAE